MTRTPLHRHTARRAAAPPDGPILAPAPDAAAPATAGELLALTQTALDTAAADSRRLGIIHLDLTDALPPSAGGSLLGGRGQVADRIRSHLVPADVLAALGENDYAVLHAGTALGIVTLADAITTDLTRPGSPGDHDTLSVDIAIATSPRDTARGLLDRARIDTGRHRPAATPASAGSRRPTRRHAR
ncbi:hypothetical protein [Tomitella cavernea]|nr:hypothetical protein [Tomitella cavernea]